MDVKEGCKYFCDVKVVLVKFLIKCFYLEVVVQFVEEEFNCIFVDKGLLDEVFEFLVFLEVQVGFCVLMVKVGFV